MFIIIGIAVISLGVWKLKSLETPKNFEAVWRYRFETVALGTLSWAVVKYSVKFNNGIEPIVFRNFIHKIISYLKKPGNPNLKVTVLFNKSRKKSIFLFSM